jgi:hypothetical protein
MRGRTRAVVASLALASICALTALAPAPGAAAGGEAPVTVRTSESSASFSFGLAPRVLPVGSATPATLDLGFEEGRPESESIGFRSLGLGFDKSISLNPRGVPICHAPGFAGVQIEAAGPVDCKSAEVGVSEAMVQFAYPENDPIEMKSEGRIYYGGHGRLLIELPFKLILNGNLDLVAPVRRVSSGPISSEATIEIPHIADGYGALYELSLQLNRPGFVTAECSTGKLRAMLAATLRDGTKAHQETIRACTR